MSGCFGYKRDPAPALQQTCERALNAVFRKNTVDEAFIDPEVVEQRQNVRVAEHIQIILLDDDLLCVAEFQIQRLIGKNRYPFWQQRSLRFAPTHGIHDAMGRPCPELRRILGMSACTRNQRNAALTRMLVQASHGGNHALGARPIQCARRKQEVDLCIDVEESFHFAAWTPWIDAFKSCSEDESSVRRFDSGHLAREACARVRISSVEGSGAIRLPPMITGLSMA